MSAALKRLRSVRDVSNVRCRPRACRDKYREPEVHRVLCGGVFLSGAHARFHADVLRDACYCRCSSDMLVRSSGARSIASGDCDGVSSREGMDRLHMRRAHDCAGNPAGISLAKRTSEPICTAARIRSKVRRVRQAIHHSREFAGRFLRGIDTSNSERRCEASQRRQTSVTSGYFSRSPPNTEAGRDDGDSAT